MLSTRERITFLTAAKHPWGAEHSLALICNELKEVAEITIICSSKETEQFFVSRDVLNVKRISASRNRVKTVFNFLKEILREKETSNYVVFSLQLAPLAFLLKFTQKRHTNTILDVHDVPRSKFDRSATRVSSFFYSKIIAISKYVARSLNFPREAVVVPRPIVEGKPKNPSSSGSLTQNMGIVGRIDPEKRHLLAFEVTKLLQDKIFLKVYGDVLLADDDYVNVLKEVAESTIPEKYCFEGSKPVDEVYESLDILFVGNENEPSGRTVGEAMTRGILPVVPDTGGASEYLPDELNWLIYKKLDSTSAAKVVNKIFDLSDKDRLHFKQLAKLWVDKQHEPHKIATQYFNQIIG